MAAFTMTSPDAPGDLDASEVVSGLGIARTIWPVLLSTCFYSLPIVATTVFVVPMATDLDVSATVVGGLRAISGIVALAVAFLLAPLIDRVPRALTIVVALLISAAADTFATVGHLGSLVVFYVLLGMTTATLLPTLQAASGDRFRGATSGQAAGMVGACQAFVTIIGGPLLSLPAMVAGWQGAFLFLAIGAVVMAIVAGRTFTWQRPPNVARTGYGEAFAIVAQAPGAVPLLLASMLRWCTWFAWLVYLGAFLGERFEASTALVSWILFVSAGAFFVCNLSASRLINTDADLPAAPWRSPTRVFAVSAALNVGLAPLVFIAPTFPLAMLATAVYGGVSGAMMAALISLLIRRYASMRGAMMALNSVGMNVGLVVGASIAGAAIGVGGYVGLAVCLAPLGAASAGAALMAARALSEPNKPTAAERLAVACA